MPLAVLGSYELIECLSKHSYAHVYLARDGAGDRFVVKFITDPDFFFEELARHYAVDDCTHVCRLVHNFPSYAVSGDPFMFRHGLAALFDTYFDGRDIGAEEMLVSPLADVGALVMEYVEGKPLAELLPHLDEPTQLKYLGQLTRAVAELHECGECHGDLISPNVLVTEDTNRLVLLDLGYFPNKPLPKGQHRAPCQGNFDEEPLAADDVYMLAHNFMNLVARPNTPLAELTAQCMQAKPAQRPTMNDIAHHFSGDQEKAVPLKRKASPRKRVLQGVLTLAALLIFSFSLWNKDEPLPLLHTREHSYNDATPRQLNHVSIASYHYKMDMDGSSLEPEGVDFLNPIAVFSHPKTPVLVGHQFLYQLGDKLALPEGLGVIFSIEVDQVLVMIDDSLRAFDLAAPHFAPKSLEESGWLVWPHEHNLPRLLEATAQLLEGWDDFGREAPVMDLNLLLRRHRNALRVDSDSVYGFYPATGAKHFVVLLSQQLDVVSTGNDWRIGLREDWPSLYLSFPRFQVSGVSVKEFCKHLEEFTGLEVDYATGLGNKPLPPRLFSDIPWQDVLDALGFDWELQISSGGPRVVIRSMNI